MTAGDRKRIVLRYNQQVLKIYWIIIGTFLASAIGFHFLYRYSKFVRNLRLLKFIRRITLKSSIFGPSNGHMILIIAFLALNAISCLLNVTLSRPFEEIAKRFGWVTMFNMPLLFSLAIKNTPFLWLMNQDYKMLNIFHRVVGWTIIIEVSFHVSLSALSLYEADRMDELWNFSQIAGWIGFFFWIVLSMTSIKAFRARFYEVFYVVHIVSILGSLIPLMYHKKRLPNWIYGILCTWALDRIIRLVRTRMGSCTLLRMPGGTIKVDVCIKQWWKTGQHALISIPSISFGQSHPFTIAAQSSGPMRFFVRDVGPGGFSSKLNHSASSRAYTVLVQGPYGAIPRLDRYEEVIFVAGGTGATWTVPLMKEFIARAKCEEKSIVKGTFIWSVRSEDCLSWFSNELIEAVYAGVDIRLFNTRQSKKNSEKTGHTPKSRFTVYQGRPNLRLLLTDVLSKAKAASVAVVVCGPSEMVSDSRFAVSESLLETEVPIGLFIEEFQV